MIRAFAADDASALEALWVAAWQAAMPAIDFDGRRPWFRAHLATLLASGAAVLVAGRPEPLGFVTVVDDGHVDQLAVSPAVQGRGVGHALIEGALARHPGGLHLSVNSDNGRAVAFYRRSGFVVCAEGVNPRSGLPVLHMRLSTAGRDGVTG